MAYLVASLVTLRAEFDKLNPQRDKASDGWIGDPSHAASESDHNPDGKGAVHAIDVDETGTWPEGCTMEKIVQHVITECRKSGETGKDRGRLKYVIYERRIWEASNGWAQRSYTGANAHDKHAHFSGEYAAKYENDTNPWGIVEKFGDDDMAYSAASDKIAITEDTADEIGKQAGDLVSMAILMQYAIIPAQRNEDALREVQADLEAMKSTLDRILERLPEPPA